MNKQSNAYTIIYITVLVILVGAALAITSMTLESKKQANADADKMRQILASVHVTATDGDISDTFDRYITGSEIVNSRGEKVEGKAFDVNVAEQSKVADTERLLPVYICELPDQGTKYIVPVYGAGLWGPIWGYVAVNADGNTIYGAYFAHQGETPGLGAEIEKSEFADQFHDKTLWKNGHFAPVAVVKAGQKPSGDEDYVNGISGGTITSKGVSEMLHDCLMPYAEFLNNLKKQ